MRLGNNMKIKKQPRKHKQQQQNPTKKPQPLSDLQTKQAKSEVTHSRQVQAEQREHKAKGEAQTHPPGRDTHRANGATG